MSWLIATEDELSEEVVLRLLKEVGVARERTTCMRKSGFGYLKARLKSCNDSASGGIKVLMLTDLDTASCPPTLISEWFGDVHRDPNFLFRVAVREVEAWLMADRDNFAAFLSVSSAKLRRDIEEILDPKAELLMLARSSRSREVKNALLPGPRSRAIQGFGYNAKLVDFVRGPWSVKLASANSPSLARASRRIRDFVDSAVN